MRLVKRSPWLLGLGMLLAGVVMAPGARADVTTDQSGSLVIYPKVISDGTRDTLIQLSNRSNTFAFVHCFYVNTMGSCSVSGDNCRMDRDCPTGETCVRTCDAQNFDLTLTAQQPIQWRVSTGRLTVPFAPPCRPDQPCQCTVDQASGQLVCPGLTVGDTNSAFVPQIGSNFEGELKCYQTDADGAPIGGNALKGTATIEDLATGQISEYNALSVLAGEPNTNRDLLLDGGEYNACPARVVFVAPGENSTDAFTGATVTTELTLASCTELFEEAVPAPVTVRIVGHNEMELSQSIEAFQFDCFLSRRLGDLPGSVFDVTLGNLWKIRVTPSSSSVCLTGTNRGGTCTTDADCPGFATSPGGLSLGCRPSPGVIGVAEQFFGAGSAAYNLHVEGQRQFDIITVTTP